MNTLDKVLNDLGDFYYVRSYGNMGDMLIAVGTEQFLSRKGYSPQVITPYNAIDKPHNLVYGGGGGFTPAWCDVDLCINLLCNEHVKKCVILPSSFNDVDKLIKHFDSRHVLFCRDAQSYEYCLSKCPKSQVFLTDDMAFQLKLEELQAAPMNANVADDCEKNLQTALNKGLARRLMRKVCNASVNIKIDKKNKTLAFLLRQDKEKRTELNSPLAYDISAAHPTYSQNKYEANLLLAFSQAVKSADIIVSDRLHACIMAYLSGCEVYMIDNSYGKLKGVYEQTMSKSERVHLIQADNLPPHIRDAWKKLNSPLRLLFYKLSTSAKQIAKYILRKSPLS